MADTKKHSPDKSRSRSITLRLSQGEYGQLVNLARDTHQSVSSLVRHLCFDSIAALKKLKGSSSAQMNRNLRAATLEVNQVYSQLLQSGQVSLANQLSDAIEKLEQE